MGCLGSRRRRSFVDLTLYQNDSVGTRPDTEAPYSVTVDSDNASGTTRLVAASDNGTGNMYEVKYIVTDDNGNQDSATDTTTENEPAPMVDSLSADKVETGDSNAEFDVSWMVFEYVGSDEDSHLKSVDLTRYDKDTDTYDDSLPLPLMVGWQAPRTDLSPQVTMSKGIPMISRVK